MVQEEFGDTKGVIRIRISKKNRQHHGQVMFGSSLLPFILLLGDPCFIYIMLYVFIFAYHCPASLDFCVLYCRPLFVFWPFHCLSFIYNFRLPLWYLQTFYASWRPGGT
jgi:hypothetical protein